MKRLLGTVIALPLFVALLACSAPEASAAPRRVKKAPPPAASTAGVVNINTAAAEQLELLPGIGPSKAKRIVAYRARRKFRRTYEIVRVRGIGRKTFRRLRKMLTVKGPTTLQGKARAKRRPRS